MGFSVVMQEREKGESINFLEVSLFLFNGFPIFGNEIINNSSCESTFSSDSIAIMVIVRCWLLEE